MYFLIFHTNNKERYFTMAVEKIRIKPFSRRETGNPSRMQQTPDIKKEQTD